jgi:hypothetical protein
VFRLITFCISIVGFAAIVWFGVTVELGDRTLFGHLRAIGNSHEAQQLWDGTKGKVTDFVGIEAARRAAAAKEGFTHPPDKNAGGPALDRAAAPVPAHAAKTTGATHTQAAPAPHRVDGATQTTQRSK